MIGLNNNKSYDFFGIKKKSKASNFSYLGLPQYKSIQPTLKVVNFIGKPVSLGLKPRKFTSIRQSYWGNSTVPIWLQENDDKRLGGKLTVEQARVLLLGKGKPKDAIKKTIKDFGRKKGRRRFTPEAARAKAELLIKGIYSKSGKLKSAKLAEAEQLYEEAIAKGKVPRTKVLKKIGEARKQQIFRIVPKQRKPEDIIRAAFKEKEYKAIQAKSKERAEELAQTHIPYKTETELTQLSKIERLKYKKAMKPEAVEKRLQKRKELKREERESRFVVRQKQVAERIEPFRHLEEAAARGIKTGAFGVQTMLQKERQRLPGQYKAAKEKVIELAHGVETGAMKVYGTEEAARKALLTKQGRKALARGFTQEVTGLTTGFYAGEEAAKKAITTQKGRQALIKGTKKELVKVGEGIKRFTKEEFEGIKEGYAGVKAGVAKATKVGERIIVPIEDILKRVEVSPEAVIERGKAIAKAVPGAIRKTWGKEETAATQKVRRYVKAGVGGLFGASITQQKFGPAIRGRPSGPSGKYMIEGKPVFEEEYQRRAAEQRAKNRITPDVQQQAPLTPEEEQVPEEQPVNQNLPSEQRPMTAGEIEESKFAPIPQRGLTSDELLMAQELAQQQDNVLNAPSFLKGELKNTGGSLLTSIGPQIMDAPNAFKGQLRTLGHAGDVSEVKLGERPQTNPMGDEYIDIELGSNKPILKKRISERWMDGRAL